MKNLVARTVTLLLLGGLTLGSAAHAQRSRRQGHGEAGEEAVAGHAAEYASSHFVRTGERARRDRVRGHGDGAASPRSGG